MIIISNTTISNNLTQLITDCGDIRDALVAKGITDASTHGFNHFADDIETMILPSGLITINANGTYDVTQKASAVVSISSSGGEYSYGYQRPSNFPDMDSVDWSTAPNGYYGVMAKDDIEEGLQVCGSSIKILGIENNQFITKTVLASTEKTISITKSDIDTDVFIIYSNHYGCNAFTSLASGWQQQITRAMRNYIECYSVGITITNNSGNILDYNGFTCYATKKQKFIRCTLTRPLNIIGLNCQDVTFKDCTFTTDPLRLMNGNQAYVLTSINFINCTASNAPTSVDRFLCNCTSLRSVDLSLFDFSQITNQSSCLSGCPKLTNFSGINIKCNWSFSGSPLLTHTSLVNILNALETVTTATTLTLGTTLKSKLTAEEIAIATAKGWTVA